MTFAIHKGDARRASRELPHRTMKEQTLAFRPEQPIFIHTPLGLIEVTRVEGKPGGGYRRLHFKLPEFMTAFIGDKNDLKQVEHVTEDKEGLLIPTFAFLSPLVNENGELVGVTQPTSLRLDETVEPAPATEEKKQETQKCAIQSKASPNGRPGGSSHRTTPH